MSKLIVVFVLLFALTLVGQVAVVVPLSDADVRQAKRLHEEAMAAADAEQAFRESIRHKYLMVAEKDPVAACRTSYREGIDNPSSWSDWSVITGTTASLTTGSYLIASGSGLVGWQEPCLTPEEKARQQKREEADRRVQHERQVEAEKYEKDHPYKYWRRGFGCAGEFEFTEDFKFLVPKPEVPRYWPMPTWSTIPVGSGTMTVAPASDLDVHDRMESSTRKAN